MDFRLDALIEFLNYEQVQSETIPVIMAHGGFLNDFLILLATCVKHSYDNYSLLENCTYVDRMLKFRNAGYVKPGLDALSRIQYYNGSERLSLCATRSRTVDGYLYGENGPIATNTTTISFTVI